MPTYTGQKFQNKTRFYLHFFNLSVGLLFSKKKLRSAISKFANAHLFRFFKKKKMRFSSSTNDENNASFRRRN